MRKAMWENANAQQFPKLKFVHLCFRYISETGYTLNYLKIDCNLILLSKCVLFLLCVATHQDTLANTQFEMSQTFPKCKNYFQDAIGQHMHMVFRMHLEPKLTNFSFQHATWIDKSACLQITQKKLLPSLCCTINF